MAAVCEDDLRRADTPRVEIEMEPFGETMAQTGIERCLGADDRVPIVVPDHHWVRRRADVAVDDGDLERMDGIDDGRSAPPAEDRGCQLLLRGEEERLQ